MVDARTPYTAEPSEKIVWVVDGSLLLFDCFLRPCFSMLWGTASCHVATGNTPFFRLFGKLLGTIDSKKCGTIDSKKCLNKLQFNVNVASINKQPM